MHVEAASLIGVDVVATVDPAPGAGASHQRFRDVDVGFDAVVVATPTPLHVASVAEVRTNWAGRVVVEKPLAATAAEADRLLDDDGVVGIYHAAFGAEVEWAASSLPAWTAAHGPVTTVRTTVTDSYHRGDGADERLGTSWLDGGVNALSILARLVALRPRTSLTGADPYGPFEGRFELDVGEAQVVTEWQQPTPEKRTVLTFASGTTATLDHAAMTGSFGAERFAAPVEPPRLVQHYVAAYRRLFLEGRRCFDRDLERQLHRLL